MPSSLMNRPMVAYQSTPTHLNTVSDSGDNMRVELPATHITEKCTPPHTWSPAPAGGAEWGYMSSHSHPPPVVLPHCQPNRIKNTLCSPPGACDSTRSARTQTTRSVFLVHPVSVIPFTAKAYQSKRKSHYRRCVKRRKGPGTNAN